MVPFWVVTDPVLLWHTMFPDFGHYNYYNSFPQRRNLVRHTVGHTADGTFRVKGPNLLFCNCSQSREEPGPSARPLEEGHWSVWSQSLEDKKPGDEKSQCSWNGGLCAGVFLRRKWGRQGWAELKGKLTWMRFQRTPGSLEAEVTFQRCPKLRWQGWAFVTHLDQWQDGGCPQKEPPWRGNAFELRTIP